MRLQCAGSLVNSKEKVSSGEDYTHTCNLPPTHDCTDEYSLSALKLLAQHGLSKKPALKAYNKSCISFYRSRWIFQSSALKRDWIRSSVATFCENRPRMTRSFFSCLLAVGPWFWNWPRQSTALFHSLSYRRVYICIYVCILMYILYIYIYTYIQWPACKA